VTYQKYNASGNDFIIFHTFKEDDYSSLAKKLCHRQEGIGADGLIALVPSKESKADFAWDFYNSDGSKASMCGNGSRAAAHYAFSNNLVKNDKKLSFISDAGIISCELSSKNIIKSEMTKPKILKESFDEDGFAWHLIDTGVPHLVTFVNDLAKFDKILASKLRKKYNANVNFAMLKNKKLFVRTFERGVEDETLACGTGMCACFLQAFNSKLLSNEAKVYPRSKEELSISFENNSLFFEGKVTKVFSLCL